MRRFDKKNNIRNANLLAEQRYLQSKELINENEINEYDSPNQIIDIVNKYVSSVSKKSINDQGDGELLIKFKDNSEMSLIKNGKNIKIDIPMEYDSVMNDKTYQAQYFKPYLSNPDDNEYIYYMLRSKYAK